MLMNDMLKNKSHFPEEIVEDKKAFSTRGLLLDNRTSHASEKN